MYDVETLKPTPFRSGIPLMDQTVNIAEVVTFCHYLGKQLQNVPREHRELAVSRLLNKSDELAGSGLAFGAMMFRTVAKGWKDVG